jgi:hypothetical protein
MLSAPPEPTAMGCYFGMRREGEIVDYGSAGVEAFVDRGTKLVKLGIFSDRKSAMRAVSEAARNA